MDDEADILESLQQLLEASIEDLHVVCAADGQEALDRLHEAPFDALVTDYKMPGMDGLELLRHARQDAPSVVRILMTAYPDLQIAIEAINEASIQTFFTKPLDPPEVVRVVTDVLRRRQADRHRERAFARAMDQARKARGAP